MIDKVVVVTGSNKGIGFCLVRELCKRGVKTVYLTARDEGRGKKAVSDLKAEGLNPNFHVLDVTDVNSIKRFAAYLKKVHGGLDILVNNAAVTQTFNTNFDYEHIAQVVDINYRSLLLIQNELFPIIKRNGRVINVSSVWGHLFYLRNPYWRKVLSNDDITIEDVNAFIDWYLESVKDKSLTNKDFLNETTHGYKASKMAMCAVTRIQQRMMEEDTRNISINSVHPGSVKTEMSKGIGLRSPEDAAKVLVYLALDIDQTVKGKYFWDDCKEVDWTSSVAFLRKVIQHFSYRIFFL